MVDHRGSHWIASTFDLAFRVTADVLRLRSVVRENIINVGRAVQQTNGITTQHNPKDNNIIIKPLLENRRVGPSTARGDQIR